MVAANAVAQEKKAVTEEEGTTFPYPKNTLLYGAGLTNQYDSYLSPMEYSGVQLDLLYARERLIGRKQEHPHLCHQSLLNLQLHTSTNISKVSRFMGGDIHYDAGWYYNWWHVGTPRLSIRAGGQAGTTIGGLYNNHSGNNPANAHAAVRASASVGAQYILPLRRTQLNFRYQADLPMLGAAFSPDYGQSFYELWKHGYYHNICLTSLINAFSLRQLALFGIRLPHSTLTFGYKADIRQAKLNNLRQHQYAHTFMIGWRKSF